MPAERFYVEEPTLDEQKQIILDGDEFHHLANVMRVRVGEKVELVNGLGTLAKAVVTSIEKHKAILTVDSVQTEKKPSYQIILAQGFPKLSKLEYVIEKSVELGVTDLWFFPATLSEKKDVSESQMKRFEHIMVSAMKQCGRLFLPNLQIKPSLLTWSEKETSIPSFFGSVDPKAPRLIDSLPTCSSLLICIGPEKGFQEKEHVHMEKNLKWKGVSLHQNILRTETAAVHSVSLASSFLMK